MRKQDKKRDNAIRIALTYACDSLLESQTGFCWLTHVVDYQHFPQSLQIILIFDTEQHMRDCELQSNSSVCQLIAARLNDEGISFPRIEHHLHYDNEVACKAQHNGNWARRLAAQ